MEKSSAAMVGKSFAAILGGLGMDILPPVQSALSLVSVSSIFRKNVKVNPEAYWEQIRLCQFLKEKLQSIWKAKEWRLISLGTVFLPIDLR